MTDTTKLGILTPEERQEAIRLCEAASVGPWKAFDNFVEIAGELQAIDTGNPIIGDSSADTEFIAAARTLLPRYESTLQALEAERAAVTNNPANNEMTFLGRYQGHLSEARLNLAATSEADDPRAHRFWEGQVSLLEDVIADYQRMHQ